MSWITESARKGKALRTHFKLKDIEIFIKDGLPEEIDPDFVFKYVASMLPEHLLMNIDIIYVGQFEHLIKRDIKAVYEDGAIFVTNEQDTEMDFIDDILHEISHANEHTYKDLIYTDGKIEVEFKKKREALYRLLKSKGLTPPVSMIHDVMPNEKVDDYLYNEVGYPMLSQLSAFSSLFVGAYSATSLREYFAAGFERYFMGEKELVKDLCPVLYLKLKALDNMEEQ
jgi:hypothetical protein